jgi:hypothetical protein
MFAFNHGCGAPVLCHWRPSNYFYYLLLLKVPVQRFEESADFISIACAFILHMALLKEIYNLKICTKYTVREGEM